MKARTRPLALFLVVLSTFSTAGAQFFLKRGSVQLAFNLQQLLTNLPLLTGLFLYAVGACLLILALKYGELSVVYPFFALSFIWVFLLSAFMLHEPYTFFSVLGVLAIGIGVALVGSGSA
ncbi:MAG: EamA family transporter [archaeon]